MYSNPKLTKTERLLASFAASAHAGGGILTVAEIAYFLNEQKTPALRKFLSGLVTKGLLRRLVSGVYESSITPPEPSTAIYKIINKMRASVLNYISLETQLSHVGEISQVTMGRFTVITKGRSGTFDTPYGVIEFTHTQKSVKKIMPNLYLDPDIKMFRATTGQAISDLRMCRRNLHMLDERS
ncbi:type IV toxin-antitoxin system AbiEi family antitoxin [Vibrio crassostreae]|uniref:type IV toxin-antitoxin system AbiEi family antitoxin n=1 Tax=Vibrio crassostreae TaxID=246167 RepID=UPI001B30368B|nr:hypothetical protein [Vibrio crassostreae]